MKLKGVRLQNYRAFDDAIITLHPKMTVFIGENCCGKTSVVSAIRLLLWSYLRNHKKEIRVGAAPTIRLDDVHIYHSVDGGKEFRFPCSVKGFFDFDGASYTDEEVVGEFKNELLFNVSGCELRQENSRTIWKALFIDMEAATKGMEAVFSECDRRLGEKGGAVDLPVIACYGTGRMWRSMVRQKFSKRSVWSFVGYDGALSIKTGFLRFEWFIFYIINLKHVGLLDHDDVSHLWSGVMRAVREVTGWEMLLPVKGEKELFFRRNKSERLKLSQLGDGVRCMIGMVGELACRCALLNYPHGEDAVKKTTGVVLIDEVDMHLHPRWQQVILAQLQAAFPQIQFIVTTHSPQVLSTVHRENIRVLAPDASGRIVASAPLARTYGEPSGDVLHAVMQVDPQPPVAEKPDLQRLTKLIDQGLYAQPEALQLMQKLQEALGQEHPQLQRLQRSIRRQQVLRG